MASDAAIAVSDLRKHYDPGLFSRRIEALRGVTFEVARGEVFGLVGPNGSGKSTTLKILLGLLFPSSGTAAVLGKPAGDVEAKRHIGFLPENPFFYDYLSGRELLDFVGCVFGLTRGERTARATQLLERVGLASVADRALRRYSKGMLQRIGLAQALIGRPDVVVLDEPMSGLDPLGRKEVRDLIVELAGTGVTVLFSTHILSDVEMLCDRVAILAGGVVRDVGPPERLVSGKVLAIEVVLEGAAESWIAGLVARGFTARIAGALVRITLPEEAVDGLLREAQAAGARVREVTPRRETLEQVFLREVAGSGPGAPA